MKAEVAVLGSPSLIALMVSVDVMQHNLKSQSSGANSPYGLCTRNATLNFKVTQH